ncbi:glycoside hydrolase [Photobacterium sp. 1_MG-2023]|uniref:glycoside hydrolase n=1 Tax=Photobacterium sp. 1_MG-2023 TaxID=3062646 RepID=UPI0026E4503B|nr:glycoside hydrolase [Photobacterium sp. 1_MG-2023]MDO6708175.1 glycoside hydrolase [Photobacterium sp. 1_MG-2023]
MKMLTVFKMQSARQAAGFGLFTMGLLCFSSVINATVLELNQGEHRVQLDPETLAMHWTVDGQTYAVNQANASVDGKQQSVLLQPQAQPNQVSWQWQPSAIQVTARLEGRDLSLDFQRRSQHPVERNHPIRLNWFDLPQDAVSELLLPFNEGMRVPLDHPQWAAYLAQEYSGSNTTQDLKMPFWTQAVRPEAVSGNTGVNAKKTRFLSFLLVNPYQNRLDFQDLTNRTAGSHPATMNMSASHDFTPLNRENPFQVLIHLGEENLSGALRYRAWRASNGEREGLHDKAARNPDVRKLIGASHVYLFGSDGIAVADVKDWPGLTHWYFSDTRLSESASEDVIRELKHLGQTGSAIRLNAYQKQILVAAINQSLATIYPFVKGQTDDDGIAAQFDAIQFRKAYLKQHASRFLIPHSQWGQSLSAPVLATLKSAGLSRLWIGLDNWLPAFFQPDVVAEAKQAGYLVATYDSYNTAIDVADNPGWLTAHLPKAMRTACAIENADGRLQRGFRGQGNYLNPGCGLDAVKRRAKQIVALGGFNSLFLDVDATGMVREDYSTGSYRDDTHGSSRPKSQQAMAAAFNQRLSWFSQQNLVLGSEDGNGITTRGVVFAHGMETTGFGWTDPDMKTNRQSPYYLGAWYPDHKPAFFFRQARVKEPYRTLFFSPAFKVPLYQAVFHDELINSHHWHTDSLKFSDVQGIRDLAGMLYNTPPMVHLNRDEAQSPERPRMRALQHYQQGFAPIHQALWDKALIGFEWLDASGNVQQTRFSDGSVLVANFTRQAQPVDIGKTRVTIPAMSLRAELAANAGHKAEVIVWQAQSR